MLSEALGRWKSGGKLLASKQHFGILELREMGHEVGVCCLCAMCDTYFLVIVTQVGSGGWWATLSA